MICIISPLSNVGRFFILSRYMKYDLEKIKYAGSSESPVCVIIAADKRDAFSECAEGVLHAYIPIENWNEELSPWPSPPVFGDAPFRDGAGKLLSFITDELIPEIDTTCGKKRFVIAGYSLSGLFSLYAICRSDSFTAAAAVSPSVWFPGWIEFAGKEKPHSEYVYLSLGDREEKTRNPVMATVGDCIRKTEKIFSDKGIRCSLEWNEGGHFKDPGLRMKKGIEAVLRNI